MSTEKKFKKVRLFRLAKQLNVSSDALVDHLKESGFSDSLVGSGINAAVASEEAYEDLMDFFADDKEQAERVSRKRAAARQDTDVSGKEEAPVVSDEQQEAPIPDAPEAGGPIQVEDASTDAVAVEEVESGADNESVAHGEEEPEVIEPDVDTATQTPSEPSPEPEVSAVPSGEDALKESKGEDVDSATSTEEGHATAEKVSEVSTAEATDTDTVDIEETAIVEEGPEGSDTAETADEEHDAVSADDGATKVTGRYWQRTGIS